MEGFLGVGLVCSLGGACTGGIGLGASLVADGVLGVAGAGVVSVVAAMVGVTELSCVDGGVAVVSVGAAVVRSPKSAKRSSFSGVVGAAISGVACACSWAGAVISSSAFGWRGSGAGAAAVCTGVGAGGGGGGAMPRICSSIQAMMVSKKVFSGAGLGGVGGAGGAFGAGGGGACVVEVGGVGAGSVASGSSVEWAAVLISISAVFSVAGSGSPLIMRVTNCSSFCRREAISDC